MGLPQAGCLSHVSASLREAWREAARRDGRSLPRLRTEGGQGELVVQEERQEKKGRGWQMRSERVEDGVVL